MTASCGVCHLDEESVEQSGKTDYLCDECEEFFEEEL